MHPDSVLVTGWLLTFDHRIISTVGAFVFPNKSALYLDFGDAGAADRAGNGLGMPGICPRMALLFPPASSSCNSDVENPELSRYTEARIMERADKFLIRS
jgi:hypothetical protein